MTALWLFDYMRKTKSQGIAEAQSGGGDSGFNSMMVRVMVELAMRELGVEGFLREMKHLKYVDAIRAANQAGGRSGVHGKIRPIFFVLAATYKNHSSFLPGRRL